jgi:hypothetical protein
MTKAWVFPTIAAVLVTYATVGIFASHTVSRVAASPVGTAVELIVINGN